MKKILLERQEELESNIKKYQNVLSGKDVTSLQDQVIYDALENAKNEKIQLEFLTFQIEQAIIFAPYKNLMKTNEYKEI